MEGGVVVVDGDGFGWRGGDDGDGDGCRERTEGRRSVRVVRGLERGREGEGLVVGLLAFGGVVGGVVGGGGGRW